MGIPANCGGRRSQINLYSGRDINRLMAVPTYEELLIQWKIDGALVEQTFSDNHVMDFASKLDRWEMLARSLRIPDSEIESIKDKGVAELQRVKLLECWKHRCGSKATYRAMIEALLQINRTDLAESIIGSILPAKNDIIDSEPSTRPSSVISLSPLSSNVLDILSIPATQSPSIGPHTTAQDEQVISTLKELEREFYDIVVHAEISLKNNDVHLDMITRRFSMLPQSIRRQYQTDESYSATRRRILNSTTTKELFDNLTELKHWNYMTPDTLAYILQDVKLDDVHQEIEKYTNKLASFKANTKLRDLIGINFPVPDYCIELTMITEGWEDKNIHDAEKSAMNMLRRATYSGDNVSIGWKGIYPGSIKLVFILRKSITLEIHSTEKLHELCKDSGITNIQVDGSIILYDHEYSIIIKDEGSDDKEVPHKLWSRTGTILYNAGGGRDVLIVASDLPLPHPEAVARRPGQLTEEDKLKLQSQGVPPDCHDELDIVKARCELDQRYRIIGIKSGLSVSRQDVLKSISHLLTTTQSDGAAIFYVGAGRRNTGDWCFEDGFITFRDIAQLYLRASHNFKGRVLSIISDCSYSGCWVRDCMEFLDEQGVQPCGHKAREKGMIIKVFTSCQSTEIPTEYCFAVSGISNEKSTGMLLFHSIRRQLRTQKKDYVDSSKLHCKSTTIHEHCTLPHNYTWTEEECCPRKD